MKEPWLRLNRFTFFLVLVLLCCSIPSLAQLKKYHFYDLSVEKGLSQSLIKGYAQDLSGFIWIATADGLSRYDGQNYVVYNYSTSDSLGLSSGNCSALLGHSDGTVWVGNKVGEIDIIQPDHRKVKRFKHNSVFEGNSISEIFEDQEGHIWIGSKDHGLFEYDPESDVIHSHEIEDANPKNLASKKVSKIKQGSDGKLWVSTERSGIFYRDSTNSFRQVLLNGSPNYRVTGFDFDADDRLWVTTYYGLFSQDKSGQNLRQVDLPNSHEVGLRGVLDIICDDEGVLWISVHRKGLFSLNPHTMEFRLVSVDPLDSRSETISYQMNEFFKDRAGMIWVATNGYGGYYFDPNPPFKWLSTGSMGPNSVSFQSARGILADPHDSSVVWLGGYSALNRYERGKGITGQYMEGERGFNAAYSLYKWSRDSLLIGTEGRGFCWLNTRTSELFFMTEYGSDSDRMGGMSVFTLFEGPEGNCWAGTNFGLFRIDRQTKTPGKEGVPPLLRRGHINCINKLDKSNLLIGSDQGMYRFNLREGKVYPVPLAHLSEVHDKEPVVRCIHVTNEVFVGTGGLGLFRLPLKSVTQENDSLVEGLLYSKNEGLPNNTVYGILEDELGYLWMSTNDGLSRFDRLTSLFHSYNYQDGLQSNEFNGASFARSQQGEFFFGGIQGITIFKPEDLTDPRTPFPLVITRFVNYATSTSFDGNLSALGVLELPHSENFFSIEFAELDFKSSQVGKYAIHLDGFQKDWVDIGNKRLANFSNLDPGDYHFQVKVWNRGGYWDPPQASLRIRIVPPYWHLWWFRSLMAVAVIGLLYFAYIFRIRIIQQRTVALEKEVQNRTREIQNKNAELERARKEAIQANKAKSEFLAMISHEIRTPMNGVLGMARLLESTSLTKEQQTYAQMIMDSGRNLLGIINDILDLTKVEAQKMELEKHPFFLQKELENLVFSLGQRASEKELAFSVFFEEQLPERVYGDAKRLGQVIINLVANAIKFTEHGGIELRACLAQKQPTDPNCLTLEIAVKDTGIGIRPERQSQLFQAFNQLDRSYTRKYGGTGLGLAICKQLVQLMGGDITVQSEAGAGSTFTFTAVLERYEGALAPEKKKGQQFKQEMGEQMPLRILVAEDNLINQKLMVAMLKKLGYECHVVENGILAVESAKKHTFDLILMDIQMPVMDGLSAAKIIKGKQEDPTARPPKIIAVTANALKGEREALIDAGMDGYLAKPIKLSELIEALQKTYLQRSEAFDQQV